MDGPEIPVAAYLLWGPRRNVPENYVAHTYRRYLLSWRRSLHLLARRSLWTAHPSSLVR
jgi:hypothetical protein